jgi:hypothetical protein
MLVRQCCYYDRTLPVTDNWSYICFWQAEVPYNGCRHLGVRGSPPSNVAKMVRASLRRPPPSRSPTSHDPRRQSSPEWQSSTRQHALWGITRALPGRLMRTSGRSTCAVSMSWTLPQIPASTISLSWYAATWGDGKREGGRGREGEREREREREREGR